MNKNRQKGKKDWPYTFDVTFLVTIICMFFVYFIVYRTDSRVAWYVESYRQFEILMTVIQDILLGK